ncbi:MAG: efflux RND transporter periplasmic adaptor subunit [Lachnospiraceae bacterium]|nr:efflux RND transporter periplasmic adaptor subunit [Lachnospiraceae bacterium]
MKNIMRHKKLIIGTCIMLAAAVGGLSVTTVMAGTAIKTAVAENGQLDCELELNGKVESLTEKTYFAKIDGRIGSVKVREGDPVKKGDLLVSYDTDELSRAQTLAELDVNTDQGTYDASVQARERVEGLYGEAKNSIPALEAQITNTEAVIMVTRKILTDRQAEFAARNAQLQADLACCVVGEDDDPADVQKARDNIQKEIAKNQYDSQYDPEIVKRQEELQYLEFLMTTYREKKSIMESQKASTQLSRQTQGDKDKLEAVKATDDILNETKLKDYEAASGGIRAGFDGVVTKISVEEGSDVSVGQEIIQIQSLADTAVVCYVNKYDIINLEEGQTASSHIKNKDYACHVSRIEKKTSDDGTTPGIRVELKIDEPDDAIILGIESKTKVRTALVSDTLLIPTDALCSEDERDYVFIIKDGKAEKRFVTVGAKNDEFAEILDGLQAGETVGWDESSELTDGQKVKVK